MKYDLILVKYGELALKGANRSVFEKRLVMQVKRANADLPEVRIQKEHGRMYIHLNGVSHDLVIERTSRVFGIVGLCPAVKVPTNQEAIFEGALEQVKQVMSENPHFKTFKIESRRTNKGFKMNSPEICRELGGFILEAIPQLTVDVHHPDIHVHVEVRDSTYLYINQINGMGGMPYGSAGRGMLLLSGGIDSPVAGFMMAKRGVSIEGVHFHSYPFTSERAKEKVNDLARKLAGYLGNVHVTSVNLLEAQQAIREKCPEEEMTILSRCMMMRIATAIAEKRECQGLITGESIGQVASQTMEGINVTNSQTPLPVYRPLIAMDKVDIIRIAKQIDTFETSILPFEDCCTVFLPSRVVTKPRLEKIMDSLSKIDVEGIVQRAVETSVLERFE